MNGKEAPLVEILLRPPKATDEWRQQWLEEKEAENMKECSFKPITNDYPLENTGSGDKNMDLYAKVKKRQYADRKTIETDAYEYRKQPDQYTFAPNINDSQKVFYHRMSSDIPGYDKVRERLERARYEKLQKDMATQRGIPAQMKEKLIKGMPDSSLVMTQKPGKFQKTFGTDGSQIVPKKTAKGAKADPNAVRKAAIEAGNRNQRMVPVRSRKGSKTQKKSKKALSPPAQEVREQFEEQQEEQKAIQQAQYDEVHADHENHREDASADETTQNQD